MGKLRRSVAAFGAALFLAGGGALSAAHAETAIAVPPKCAVPDDLIADSSPLPHAAKTVQAGHSLKIVALGSSSTLGLGASGAEAAWPARLQEALTARLPGVQVDVINKGVARQSAQQMIDRIDADVLAEKPALVVWETGTAEAVRGADIDEFTAALLAGIDHLEHAGIDVILMDTQYSRSTAQLINFPPYVAAIEQVAGMRDLVRFPRYAVMQYWVESDRFTFSGKSAAESRKLADQVYDCLGHLLAVVIARDITVK